MIAKVYAFDKNGKKFSWLVSYLDEKHLKESVKLNLIKYKAPWYFHAVLQASESHGSTYAGEWLAIGYLDAETFTWNSLSQNEDFTQRMYLGIVRSLSEKKTKRKTKNVIVRVFSERKEVVAKSKGFYTYNFSIKHLRDVNYTRIANENKDATTIHVLVDGKLEMLHSELLRTLRSHHFLTTV